MRNAGLEEAQAGIKIAGRNIDILRYAGDPTLMVESEEKLKSYWFTYSIASQNAYSPQRENDWSYSRDIRWINQMIKVSVSRNGMNWNLNQ